MTVETEIGGYTFAVGQDWYSLPLDDESSPRDFARQLLLEVSSTSSENAGAFVDDVSDLLQRLRLEHDGNASAALLVRAEGGPRVGALAVHAVHVLSPEDTPDSYEEFARQSLSSGQPGRQSLAVQTWQLECAAGPAVGVRHVVTAQELGGSETWVEERTIFAVFVSGTRQMVQFTFTTADFMAFSDMASETWSIVSTLSVQLEETV